MAKNLKKIPLNILLTAIGKERLKELSEAQGISMGACARAAIHAAWLHIVRRSLRCADGRACLMPHMHAPTSPAGAGAPATPQNIEGPPDDAA